MTVSVRFAPSPTGFLHVGNARIAIVNWLYAKANGGTFLLRLDDTDSERSTAEYAAAIKEDVTWLGLTWDRFARESDRMDRYEVAVETLKATGRLYPAWETAAELDLRRKLQVAQGRPPIYDRAALKLTDEDKARLTTEQPPPHWRFRLDGRKVAWTDLVKGPVEIDTASLSDPVLIRGDGRPLYTLTSVVDDIDLAITHVIRGEDHVTNSGVQIEIFEALGGALPTFGHLSLLTDATGGALSKRLGALSLHDLREDGVEPLGITSLLARLGTADPVAPRTSLDEIVTGFDLTRFSKSSARFNPEDLQTLSARVLHHLPFASVAGRLPPGATDAFWTAVQNNLTVLAEACDWWRIVTDDTLETPMAAAGLLDTARDLLPDGQFDETTWGSWTKAIAAATGMKGKSLFQPLRLALTGRDHGPEMRLLLPLIGRERTARRLQRGD